MKTLWLAALALASCTSGGVVVSPQPDPGAGRGLRVVAHTKGDADVQAFLDTVPLTAYYEVHGDVTTTARPFPPYLWFEVHLGGSVTPPVGVPPAEAQAAIDMGLVRITRDDGKPAFLSPPRQPMPMPVPTPPPPPIPETKPPCPPVADCAGGSCEVPQ